MHDLVRYEPDLPELRDPLLIAAFSGAWGASAAAALRELAVRWETAPLASLEPQPFYDFSVVRPRVRAADDGEDGAGSGGRVVEWPGNEFLLARPEGADRDLVLLIGAEPQLRWRRFAGAITETLDRLGVRETLMLGAFRAATPHSRPLPVQLFSRDAVLAARFGLVPERWAYEGPAGIATLLGASCEERGRATSSLLAAAPFYVAAEPHPFAVRALVAALGRGLGVEAPTDELDEQIRELCDEAERARERSSEFAGFVDALERRYDEERPPLDAIDTAAAPPAPELLSDVESFLRQHRGGADGLGDVGDGGAPPSEAASGSQ